MLLFIRIENNDDMPTNWVMSDGVPYITNSRRKSPALHSSFVACTPICTRYIDLQISVDLLLYPNYHKDIPYITL